jgi:hypothetical protein
MNFKDSLREAIGALTSMLSLGFLIFIFGVLLPVLIGLAAFAMAMIWSAASGYYAITALSLLAGVGWFFFWLNFTDDWITL